MTRAFPVSLHRPLDLLHERLVLEYVQSLLLPLPVLGTDDDEIRPSTTLDAQRDVVVHHFLDLCPQASAELVNRYLSHEPNGTRNWYRPGPG
jgi:hypothetical protein